MAIEFVIICSVFQKTVYMYSIQSNFLLILSNVNHIRYSIESVAVIDVDGHLLL